MVTAQDIEAARLAYVEALESGTEAQAEAARRALWNIVSAAKREWLSERAAIREYDGGQSRRDAERDAWTDLGGES